MLTPPPCYSGIAGALISLALPPGGTATIAVIPTPLAPRAFNPGADRVFVQFWESRPEGLALRGATSVAVRTQQP